MPLFQNDSSCKTFQMKMSLIKHKNEPVGGTYFHVNGFARRLVLTQRRKASRKMAYCVAILVDEHRLSYCLTTCQSSGFIARS